MARVSCFFLAMLWGTSAFAAETIWIEGETPSQNPLSATCIGDAEHPEYLSAGKWLRLSVPAEEVTKKVPAEGALVGYDFEVKKPGKYQVWNRIGLESIRSPFDWKIDGGEWKTIPILFPYTDLMDIGFFNELTWVKLGEADLTPGKHNLQIRVLPSYGEEKKKGPDGKETTEKKLKHLLYVADCFCLSLGEFYPNGKFQPGSDWMSADDKKAATQVFEVKAGSAGEERITTPLAGLWQVSRYDEFEPTDRSGPDKALPEASAAFWSAIPVPGDKYKSRPDLNLAHRLVYRTKIQVPADMKGRSFVLHFPSNNMISSVFVNGQFCGWTKAMLAPWDCDVTAAIKPGQANEVAVIIKDTYYAISPNKAKSSFGRTAFIPPAHLRQNWVGQYMDFPVQSHPESGILETPSLVTCGSVYAADVFAKPSVKKKELGLEITLKNPGLAEATAKLEVEVVPLAGGAAEKTFAPKELKIAAGKEEVVNLTEAWANPKLWWPDDPQQYNVVTKVSVGGKVVDIEKTKFGFREWECRGNQFVLNGIPWHGRADCTMPRTAEECFKTWRAHDQNMMRFWGLNWCGMDRPEALDVLDKEGMVVRFTGIFDGEGGNYLHGLSDPVLFDNWTTHLEAWVKAFRNHPSILIWSIENEITFINSRNLGQAPRVEPLVTKAAKRVAETDPTRPYMVDGGRCLMDESLPVNGCHYEESQWREYPDEAYTLARAYKSHELDNMLGWSGRIIWRLVPDRPIFMGESYYLRGERPAAFAQFGGECCFTGWQGCRPGAGLYAKILSEGYRWHGLAAYQFWLGDESVTNYYNSWRPVAVLCRQWNWTFGGGSTVERTLKVFNDTRYGDPIEMGWELTVDGKRVAGEKKPYQVAPGEAQETTITLPIPSVTQRTKGQLVLTCSRGGKEVFRDVKEIAVLPPDGGPKPALKAGELAVLDPNGAVKTRLQQHGIAFTELKPGDEIPPAAKVVVVGPDALDPRTASEPKWLSFAARGGRVLVLDQSNPLRFTALPADLEATAFAGRIAFAENLQHPAFQGLDQPDFFTWPKDNLVYRNVYRKAARGAKSLAHCDQDLGFTCLSECEVNDGLMVLCQMLVGTKLNTDPVANRLFDNLLAYCAAYQPVRKAAAVAFDEKTPRGKLLADSGLACEKVSDPLAAIQSGKVQIVVADANPANLKSLADNLSTVKAFTEKGGWLFLWGLTPEGLADFNKIVGVEHLIRPFIRERVTLPAQRDPILSGLTLRDVVMESGQAIAFYAGRFMASDCFSYIVDYDDVAPFLKMPDWKQFNPGKDKPDADKDPSNLVNGFLSTDDWRYIFQIVIKPEFMEWDMELPREETLVQFDLVPNGGYKLLNGIELTYDGDTKNPITLKVEPKNELQSFPLPDRKVKKIHLKITGWEENEKKGKCVGIDNLWFKAQRSPEFYAKVKPLLNIGGLMKYPQGAGGVILCQVNIPEHEELAENAQKKRNIVTTLLRNVGAVFAGGKVVVAGSDLAYVPVPLNDACNLFLTKELAFSKENKGWFSDEKRDLGHFPVGEQKLAGVTYAVRDFKTSPLPCAITLGGPGAKDKPMEVKDIKVDKQADALFFLHTLRRTRAWQMPRDGDKTPPAVFKYVIHYADGQTAEVPVRYGEDVDHWVQKQPQGCKNAVVAWAAPFPKDESGDQAVVYQMQWTNPRPQVKIATIDVAYDTAAKTQYGVPVVLAITAAQAPGK